MNRWIVAMALSGMFVVVGGSASAQRDGNPLEQKIEQLFRKYDKDRNGKIDSSELTDASTFDSLDADGDGFITREDFGGSGGEETERPEQAEPERRERPDANRPERPEGTRPDRREEGRRRGGDRERGPAGGIDQDGDGQVTEKEFLDLFRRMDGNGDGVLDRSEMERMLGRLGGEGRPEEDRSRGGERGQENERGEEGERGRGRPDPSRMRENFKRMDQDGDGSISREEWRGPEEAFGRIDADGDGTISTEEAEEAMSRRRGGRPGEGPPDREGDRRGPPDERRDPPDEPRDDGREAQRGRPMEESADLVKRLDRNGDGSIARDELPGPMQDRFDDLDADGDGQLTAAELESSPAFKRSRGR